MKTIRLLVLMAGVILSSTIATAQLAKDNPCKFLGNITTTNDWSTGEECDWTHEGCNLIFTDYWNQITCENATKWGSVHSGWGRFNWSSPDKTAKYCEEHGIIFKYHALIWGSQHPGWIETLSVDETKKAIVEWYDEVKKHFPNLEIIDVVNEAIYSGGDYHSPYKSTKIIQALGSLAEDRAQRETGTRPSYNCGTNGYPNTNSYQWLAEAFRMARERWPNAILIYNDYNTFQWQKTEFINLINGIKACGGPIDAAGNQAHDLNDMGGSQFKNALEEIHNKTQLPQYITEYDIAKSDDATFETRYKEQFPIMWEADYVAGVTLWGWIYGKTWVANGSSGLFRNCQARSAFTWLQNYMKTDKAKNAQSPFCGKKGISATITLSSESVVVGDEVSIQVEATTGDGSISDIIVSAEGRELNNNNGTWIYTAENAGTVTIKIVVKSTTGDSREYEKSINVCDASSPFNGTAASIPGTIEAEDFDKGCPEVSYFDTDTKDEGDANYRNDNTGVDIVKGNDGNAIGYTAKGEWLNYTIDVKTTGEYKMEAYVASGNSSSSFTVSCGNSNVAINVPMVKENSWSEYSVVEKTMNFYDEGLQTLRIEITSPYCNIDKLVFTCTSCQEETDVLTIQNQSAITYDVYTTLGVFIGQITNNPGEDLGRQLIDLTGHKGIYILKSENKSQPYIVK